MDKIGDQEKKFQPITYKQAFNQFVHMHTVNIY